MRQWIWNKLFNGKAAAWTAACTLALTAFTYLLYRVSNETNQTARITQRAFLVFNGLAEGVDLNGPPDPKTKAVKRVMKEVYVNWYNAGPTPARGAVGVSNFQLWRSDLPEGFDFHDMSKLTNPNANRIVVGPHQNSPQPLIVTIENFAAQRAGTDRMFFWGWVAYEDAFPGDPPRLTEFCSEMIQVALPDPKKDITDPTNHLAWNIQPCHAHSCYDEDCPDYTDRIKEAEFVR